MGTGNTGDFPNRAGCLPVHEGTGGNEDDNEKEDPDSLNCPENNGQGP
jgi:hypothetical protein